MLKSTSLRYPKVLCDRLLVCLLSQEYVIAVNPKLCLIPAEGLISSIRLGEAKVLGALSRRVLEILQYKLAPLGSAGVDPLSAETITITMSDHPG